MTTKSIVSVAPLLLLMASFALCSGEEPGWDYPKSGPNGTSLERAGNAGKFRTYYCTSDDSAEKVVLWYAKRLGLPKDHSLVTTAEKGFSNLENQTIIKSGYGHDTDDRKDHTTMVALLAPAHVHITFLHRPGFDGNQDVTISISSSPDGKTSMVVIRPVLGEVRQAGGNP